MGYSPYRSFGNNGYFRKSYAARGAGSYGGWAKRSAGTPWGGARKPYTRSYARSAVPFKRVAPSLGTFTRKAATAAGMGAPSFASAMRRTSAPAAAYKAAAASKFGYPTPGAGFNPSGAGSYAGAGLKASPYAFKRNISSPTGRSAFKPGYTKSLNPELELQKRILWAKGELVPVNFGKKLLNPPADLLQIKKAMQIVASSSKEMTDGNLIISPNTAILGTNTAVAQAQQQVPQIQIVGQQQQLQQQPIAGQQQQQNWQQAQQQQIPQQQQYVGGGESGYTHLSLGAVPQVQQQGGAYYAGQSQQVQAGQGQQPQYMNTAAGYTQQQQQIPQQQYVASNTMRQN